VLEIGVASVAVVACHAPADRCDALEREVPGAVRIAADELLVIDRAGSASVAGMMRRLAGEISPEALVFDASDGWSGVRLAGESAPAAFEHLSRLELPTEGVLLGDVARAPAIVRTDADGITILVPASWEAHLRARILERCAHLGPREVTS
jgi:hypothetical protein